MKKLSALIAVITMGLGSCSSSPPPPPPTATNTPSPSPTVSASATPTPSGAASGIVSLPPRPTINVPGLVPSIDPNKRREKVDRGRQDPFASFPIQKTVKIKARQDIIIAPPSKSGSNKEKNISKKPVIIQQPSLPSPDLANATLVTGVITVSNTIKVILKAPNESTSRYVQPGQYISNGQVRVKRVENARSSMPTVVLEEHGQEVRRQVGQAIIAQPKPRAKLGATLLGGS